MNRPIRFDNGAAYERYMGLWSQRVGDEFLEWISVPDGLDWLDVGCGNGAFTELMVARTAPRSVKGVDPSPDQIAFARTRPTLASAEFHEGDAMALPFDAAAFDIAVMPLVIHFVPEPRVGVAEMVRVVRRGGMVAAYVWDMEGGGFPYANLQEEMRAREMTVPRAPKEEFGSLAALRTLWQEAGLESIETRAIRVTRTFENFDDYWKTVEGGPSVGRTLGELPAEKTAELRTRMRELLPADANGGITYAATANAVRGIVRG